MAFRQPKGWLLTASPRRNPRQPFRRAPFPRGSGSSRLTASRQPAPAAAPAGAPAGPWWKAMLDALAMAPARNRAPRDDEREASPRDRIARVDRDGKSHDSWRPVTERLDRQREQLTSMDGHLRRLVELQTASHDDTAVYAPPA